MHIPAFVYTPRIIKRTYNSKEKQCLCINVVGNEYLLCDTSNIKQRIDCFGEMAFAKMMGEAVSLAKEELWENYVGTYLFRVICTPNDQEKGYVACRNERGAEIPLSEDVYVFSFIENNQPKEQTAAIIFVGYFLKSDVERCSIWGMSYEVPYYALRPISHLRLAKERGLFNRKGF